MLQSYVQLQIRLKSFLSNERGGERDTLTTLLMLALIIIPLVLVIIAFGDKIIEVAQQAWDDIMGQGLTP